jgi:hypothetical protein
MPRYDAVKNQYIFGNDADADVAQSADGAVPHSEGTHAITKAGIAVLTIAQPTAAEEGMRMVIVSRTAFAHTLTVTGGLGGNAADDVCTFAKVGDNIELLADALRWVPIGTPYGVVIS